MTHKPRLRAAILAVALTTGLAAPSYANPDTTGIETRPIYLGTSGSSQTVLQIKALLYCYSGTLGSLVTDGTGSNYILSNNHVLAKENENLAYGSETANATIIQPGLLDEGTCSVSSGDPNHAVADLATWIPIQFGKGRNKPENTVDAAIAAVRDGAVDPMGSILGIGTVNGWEPADVGYPVQKTGRTTGHTFGTVEAINVQVDVSYESGTARFINQIRIRRPCGDAGFSDAGDSGSLIATVPESGAEPVAVGLLFAGGDTDTFANPIGEVLDALQVDMVAENDGIDNEGAMMSDYNAIADNCPTSGGGGGGNGGGGPHGPPFGALGPVGLDVARDVQDRHSDELFGLPDVVGHGISADSNGDAVIEIYVAGKARRAADRTYPSQLEGIQVRIVETGPVRAF